MATFFVRPASRLAHVLHFMFSLLQHGDVKLELFRQTIPTRKEPPRSTQFQTKPGNTQVQCDLEPTVTGTPPKPAVPCRSFCKNLRVAFFSLDASHQQRERSHAISTEPTTIIIITIIIFVRSLTAHLQSNASDPRSANGSVIGSC